MGVEVNDSSLLTLNSSLSGDSTANDPHNREYYLAQIPFSEEQMAASNAIIEEGLLNSGIIFKDKLDNLGKAEQMLSRLTTQYPEYERNDEAWYHLFLLYSRRGNTDMAAQCVSRLETGYAESEWTQTVTNPYFADNARFGVHLEDSLYAATYQAFKDSRHAEVYANAKVSDERFPQGENRPKFIFINALTLLNDGDAAGCAEKLKTVVEKYPESEVTEMAGMIVKGIQEGRPLHGGKFDIGNIWERRSTVLAVTDSVNADTLSVDVNTDYVFVLAYDADSIDQNRMLYEMARYNFTSFMVRDFNIEIDNDNGISRMIVSGFLSYDEALQYVRRLYSPEGIGDKLEGCRRIIISKDNLKLLGTRYSYRDYELFFEKELAPLPENKLPLLNEPEENEELRMRNEESEGSGVGYPEYNGGKAEISDPSDPSDLSDESDESDKNNTDDTPQNTTVDFDDDFYR